MSTTSLELTFSVPTPEEPPADLLFGPSFEYPGADIILRSRDSHNFRVPKS